MGLGTVLDRGTQALVRLNGRRVALADHPWLAGPTGGEDHIGDAWIDAHARRVGATVDRDAARAGLLPAMSALDGPGFRAADLDPAVVDFYERTAAYRLDLWSEWSPALWAGGWLVTALFSRRLQQLNLPMRPLDVSRGMDSEVLPFRDEDGEVVGTVWQRTLRHRGETVYGGFYGTARLPGSDRPSVRVVFPLPNGRLSVYLRPESRGGRLVLRSPISRFGGDGAYRVVDDGPGHVWVARAPFDETFEVYVDDDGELRCDHVLRLGRTLDALRLHYRMVPCG